MFRIIRLLASILVPVLCAVLCACATAPRHLPETPPLTYAVAPDESRRTRFAPVFVVAHPEFPYNRIGTPSACRTGDAEQVRVDPAAATLYTRVDPVRTRRGTYTNLVYRVHFERVPPGHLVQGRNVGLLVIVTLDAADTPLLYTTVHTCGCYLAFIPTTALPATAYPPGWQVPSQEVYGERLPGRLDATGLAAGDTRVVIVLRNGTHRVKEVKTSPAGHLETVRHVTMQHRPMADLGALPLDGGGTTSFFETKGARRGYVKGSQKPLERLLMSWWAMDWRIGEDKILGRDKTEGIQFYTSLKPWARNRSDLRDFTGFLAYWEWGL